MNHVFVITVRDESDVTWAAGQGTCHREVGKYIVVSDTVDHARFVAVQCANQDEGKPEPPDDVTRLYCSDIDLIGPVADPEADE